MVQKEKKDAKVSDVLDKLELENLQAMVRYFAEKKKESNPDKIEFNLRLEDQIVLLEGHVDSL